MKLYVFMDVDGRTIRVGQLFAEHRRGRLTSAFAYDNDYLSQRFAYAIDPALPLNAGTWPVAGPLPRAFLDTAPDRWGRNLIVRQAELEAAANHVPARTLDELDYLLGVSDVSRQGALRFSVSADPVFERPNDDVPKLIQLPTLLGAVRRLAVDDQYSDEAVKTLLDMGSASLGGARPKASVLDGQRMMIAKFGHPHDQWDHMAWEKTALDLAEIAGVEVPSRQLMDVEGSSVLLVDRFDRTHDGRRLGYMSAMTLCEADYGEQLDYLQIAERLAPISASPQEDLRQLWQRIIFGVAINNTDDHLRNHGFVRTRSGWRLSPAFDVNPDPILSARHATSIGGEVLSSVAGTAAMEAVPYFGLNVNEAKAIVSTVYEAVRQWQTIAVRNTLSEGEISRFEPVFAQGLSTLETVLSG